jgi:hypothetical protein
MHFAIQLIILVTALAPTVNHIHFRDIIAAFYASIITILAVFSGILLTAIVTFFHITGAVTIFASIIHT